MSSLQEIEWCSQAAHTSATPLHASIDRESSRSFSASPSPPRSPAPRPNASSDAHFIRNIQTDRALSTGRQQPAYIVKRGEHRHEPYANPTSPTRKEKRRIVVPNELQREKERREERVRRREELENKAGHTIQAAYAASARKGGRVPTDLDAFGYGGSFDQAPSSDEEEAAWDTVEFTRQLKKGTLKLGRPVTVDPAATANLPASYKKFQPVARPKMTAEIITAAKFKLPLQKKPASAEEQAAEKARNKTAAYDAYGGRLRKTNKRETYAVAPNSKLTLFRPKTKDQHEEEANEREKAAKRARALAGMDAFSIAPTTSQAQIKREAEAAAAKKAEVRAARLSLTVKWTRLIRVLYAGTKVQAVRQVQARGSNGRLSSYRRPRLFGHRERRYLAESLHGPSDSLRVASHVTSGAARCSGRISHLYLQYC